MIVLAGEKVPIARLLTFLEYGERLAQECAAKQSAAVGELHAGRFLSNQARQEGMHAHVFHAAILWLSPRHLGGSPCLPALDEYRKKLDEALSRQELYETFLAEQVILEGLGEAILSRIERGLVKRGAPFGRLRRVLLHQEEAHHSFGKRMIDRALATGQADRDELRCKSRDYLALTQTMVLTLADLFDSIDEDPAAWVSDVRTYLPAWLS